VHRPSSKIIDFPGRTNLDRRVAITILACALAACDRRVSSAGQGPLDTSLLDRQFPALAERASPGVFDAGVMSPATGHSWFWNADKSFPMESVFMLPLAAAALAEVDAGRLKLGERIKITDRDLSPPYSAIDQAWPTPPGHHAAQMPAIDLIALAVQASDNTAADVIMKRIGGPGAVTAWLRQVRLSDMRVDRYARELQQDLAGMESFRPQWKDEAVWLAARDTVAADAREAAMNTYVDDPRDSVTVRGVVGFLSRLSLGELLSAASTRLLLGLMSTSRAGVNRLAAGLPAGAVLAHKSGGARTDLGFTAITDDVGIVTFKGGRRLVMAAFLARSTATQNERDKLFADTARLFTEALR